MPQVFGCPNCQNPFQVPDDAAGQTFQCPSCESTIEVPAPETERAQPEPQSQPHADPEVFQCPHCAGQFGIAPKMYGENLSCPHCENVVAIGPAPKETIVGPEIVANTNRPEVPDFVNIETQPNFHVKESGQQDDEAAESESQSVPSDPLPDVGDNAEVEEVEPLPQPVFEPQPVDHLLPPRFAVPDPVRFPARLGSSEVILPDGEGGYRAVDANIVTVTHNGEVYQLKRLTPEERRRRRFIHNTIAIGIAVLLIYLTLQTLGVLS